MNTHPSPTGANQPVPSLRVNAPPVHGAFVQTHWGAIYSPDSNAEVEIPAHLANTVSSVFVPGLYEAFPYTPFSYMKLPFSVVLLNLGPLYPVCYGVLPARSNPPPLYYATGVLFLEPSSVLNEVTPTADRPAIARLSAETLTGRGVVSRHLYENAHFSVQALEGLVTMITVADLGAALSRIITAP